jgi:hypothetical protein
MQLWPHSFTATIRITLTDHALRSIGKCGMRACKQCRFRLLCIPISASQKGNLRRYWGWQNSSSYDKLTQANAAASGMDQLIVKNAIDSIYAQTPDHLILQTGLGELQIDKHGFPDTVVWTPGMRARGKLLILQMMKGVRSSAWRQLA